MAAMVLDNDCHEKSFKCRSSSCSKAFTPKTNRNRHEKQKGHASQQKLNTNAPVYDEETKLFACPSSGCKTASKYKRAVQLHLDNGCQQYKKRKVQRENIKVCNFCGQVFAKKSVSNTQVTL